MTPSDRATADGENIRPERSAARVEKVPFNFRLGQWNLFSIARPLSVLEVEAGAVPPGWEPDPADSEPVSSSQSTVGAPRTT